MKPLLRVALLLPLLGLFAFATGAYAANVSHATASAALNYFALQPDQQAVMAVVIDVNPGLHAQSHTPADPNAIACTVDIDPNPAIKTYEPVYPAGKDETFPALGKLNVYTGRTTIYVPLTVEKNAALGATTISGSVQVQICDDRTCFPPENLAFDVKTMVVAPGTPIQPNQPGLFTNFEPSVFSHLLPPQTVADASFKILGLTITRDSYLLAFAAAVLVGLIFNVMPCVLPVLPLKAIGFYEVSQHNRARSFSFGLVFSLGIVAMFAVLARLIFVTGIQWGQLFSYTWFIWAVCVVLVVMALSAFGLFAVGLPTGLYAFEPRHDTYVGNFLFGILTAILSTPCTAPFFPPLLLWAASHTVWIGTGLMMTVGLGMALPYLFLSALPELARKIPRTGPWSELVKQMMGFLLLPVAAYLLIGHYRPEIGIAWIICISAIVGAILLVTRTAMLMPRFRPIAVSSVIGLLLIAGGGCAVALAPVELPFRPFTPNALAAARADGRIVMVDFTAQWCLNCKWIESHVFPEPAVRQAIADHRVTLLKADLTQASAVGWPALKQLNPSGGIPLTAIYVPGRDEPIQLASIYTAADLLKALNEADKK